MKNLLKQVSLMLVALSLVFVYSCNKEDDPEPAKAPSMTVSIRNKTENKELKDGDVVNILDSLTFDVKVTAPGGFNVLRIKEGSTTKKFDRTSLGLDKGTTSATVKDTVQIAETAGGGSVSYTFEAVDERDSTEKVEFKFTVAKPVPVETHTAVLLGGQRNAEKGSFYNALENKVLRYRQASENSEKVDFLYFYGEQSGSAIAAVGDDRAQIAFGAANASITGFETKNATVFKKIDATVAGFDVVKYENGLSKLYVPDVSTKDTRVDNLKKDEVFGFQLADDRKGVLGIAKVVKIEGTSGINRSITLAIKIPKQAKEAQ